MDKIYNFNSKFISNTFLETCEPENETVSGHYFDNKIHQSDVNQLIGAFQLFLQTEARK